MNAAANYDPAFRERSQRGGHKWSHRREDDRGVEFLRRDFIGTAGPFRTQFFRCFLASFIARSREREKLAALIKRNLSDQARGVTKTINAEPMRLARFAQRPITQQARAKQRRGLDIVVTIGQPKTKPRAGDGKLGITATDGVACKSRIVAMIVAARPQISASSMLQPKPRNA